MLTSDGTWNDRNTSYIALNAIHHKLVQLTVGNKNCPYLIDGVANGMHVLPRFPQLAPVLLDEANHYATANLIVIRIIILFL